MKKVLLYINQFFGGIGGEEKADFEPKLVNGTLGPGIIIQKMLKDAEITHTIICGDNFMNTHKEEALSRIRKFIETFSFDLFLAGPAFQSGRYGMSCGEICKFISENYNIPAITSMNQENPGVEAYHECPQVYIMKGHKRATNLHDDVVQMASLANKFISNSEILWASAEGYFEHGVRKEVFVDKTSCDRAVDMLLAKLSGDSYETEYKIEIHDTVPPAKAIADIKNSTIAIITSGGLVPIGNPDHMPSGTSSIWKRYPIDNLDAFRSGEFYSVHGGFSTNNVNKDPEVLLPLSTIKELNAEGAFGHLHPFYYVTTGNLTTLKESQRMGKEIANTLKEEKVDGAIFVST
jgi:glycine/betaine/sarcosine/D-proline reductase family selenoprotein B